MKKYKSVREMTPRERKRHSLTTRSFLGIQALFFALGVVITVLIQRRKKAQGMKPPQDHDLAGNP